MLAVEKTHHINVCIYGEGMEYVAQVLQQHIPDIKIVPNDETNTKDEECVDIMESTWYKEMSRLITPGRTLLIRRENKGWTQAELSEKTGIAIPNISLMEADKRAIGLRTAKKLSAALNCDISDFIN